MDCTALGGCWFLHSEPAAVFFGDKLQAQRKAGGLLDKLEKGKPGPKKLPGGLPPNSSPYQQAVEESEIDQKKAARWQQVAAVPEE